MKLNHTQYRIQNTEYRLRGQSLIEILIALALGVVLIGGSVTLMGVSLRGYRSFKNHLQAIISTRQAMEITQAIIRANWHSISDLTPGIHYKIAKRGNSYTFQKGEEKVFDDTNLVSYWNMDGGSGQIAYDNKSTNNGILMSSPTWKSGSDCVSGSCLEFNGSTNYVNFSSANVVEPNTGTIEAWINALNWDSNRMTVFSSEVSPAWVNLRFVLFSNSNNSLTFSVANGTNSTQDNVNTGAILNPNEWYHIVGTYDGSEVKIYVNGIEKDSYLTSIVPGVFTPTKTMIGWHYSDRYFNGSIDEVRIYNTALTVEEINEHYKAGLDKLGLVGYWSMDENGGTLAYDNANSNNGILYNSPIWQVPSNCVSGSCLSFDGSSNYYVRSDDDMLLDSSQTYSVWAYPQEDSGLTGVLTTHNYSVTSNIGINTYDNKFSISIGYTDGTREYSTKQSNYLILTNKWTHIVLIYNNNENSVSFYINGAFDSKWNLTKTVKFTSEKILVGQWSNNYLNNYKFNGFIDEVRIYNRALSEQEINNRYQAGYTRYITFNKVSRTSGNIDTTYSPNNDDSSTLKAISTIKYGEGLVSEQSGGILSVANYFTRSENSKVFHQTDWLGGSGITGPVSNPSNEYDASSNITISTVGQITLTDSESAGELTSSIFDTGVSSGAGFNSLLWQGSLGTGGAVKFQIAFSNDEDGPWTYYGPTSTSDWYQPNPDISSSFPTVGTASPQNKRYIRYKVNLSTSSATPTINDIIINWTP